MLKFFSLDRTYTKWLQATVDKVHDHVLAGVWERSSVKLGVEPLTTWLKSAMSKAYYRCVTALAACGLVNKSAVMNGSGEMNGHQSWTGAWSKITTLTCQLSIASRDLIALQQPRRVEYVVKAVTALQDHKECLHFSRGRWLQQQRLSIVMGRGR
ncbi:hypothetical protein PC121_g19222 [Phytophthora cactorum]|nr:hypothetical protein PC121_g19222 [Phytophthora cactorum]